MGGGNDEAGSVSGGGEVALTVNLQVVSPSVGVGTLSFPATPATTTISQLKAKIRDSLPLRPVDEHQRLIHRGRMLARDNDTLIDVFGVAAVSLATFSSP
jgi:hypothetical protein